LQQQPQKQFECRAAALTQEHSSTPLSAKGQQKFKASNSRAFATTRQTPEEKKTVWGELRFTLTRLFLLPVPL
jgi:hypothetical protein